MNRGAFAWEAFHFVPAESSPFVRSTSSSSVRVSGLYLHGPAGAGKSMAMDLFHYCCQQANLKTGRLHFHEFMYSVHRALFALKSMLDDNQSANDALKGLAGLLRYGTNSPYCPPGVSVGTDHSNKIEELLPSPDGVDVLCFDELAITSIQDCTVLTILLTEMVHML